MMKRLRNCLMLFVALVLVFTVLPFETQAATGSMHGITITNVTLSENDTVFTGSVSKAAFQSCTPVNIVLTNTNTYKAQVSFNYEGWVHGDRDKGSYEFILGTGAAKISDQNGQYALTMEPQATLTIKISVSDTWGGGAGYSFKISNVVANEVVPASNMTVSFAKGTVTFNNTAVTNGQRIENVQKGDVLKASGTGFIAWIDSKGQILSHDPTYTVTPFGLEMSVTAVYDDGVTPWFYVTGRTSLIRGLDAASAYSGDIVLAGNATLPAGTYTINKGSTLVIPYDILGTYDLARPASANVSTQTGAQAFRTMKMASGAKIIVNGTMSVPAKVFAGHAGSDATAPYQYYGQVAMESGSSIEVNGSLSVYGYITGEGTVTANKTAHLYEAFRVTDFRGGEKTADIAVKVLGGKRQVFPLSQYYVQNIEVPLTMHSGAVETAFVLLYMQSKEIESSVDYIGQSGCMFNLTSGTLTKEYDRETDRQVISINGDLNIDKFEMTIHFIIDYPIKSVDYVLPITNSITVNIDNGTVSMGSNMSVIPGAQINIGKNGKVVLGSGKSLYVYDLDQWKGQQLVNSNGLDVKPLTYVPDRLYTRTADDLVDGQIYVEGILDVSAGSMYTSAGGAAIIGAEGGKVIMKSASTTNDIQLNQVTDTDIYVDMYSAKLRNEGEEIFTDSSKLSGSHTYTYTNGIWACDSHKAAAAVVENSVEPTCYGAGSYDSVIYCDACGTQMSRETKTVDAVDHKYENYVNQYDATCQKNGTETAFCVYGCGESHNREIADSKLSHSFTSYTPNGDATCETDGTMSSACVYGCGTVDQKTDVGSAVGHNYVMTDDSAVWADDNSSVTVAATCGNAGCEYPQVQVASVRVDEGGYAAGCETNGAKTFTGIFNENWMANENVTMSEVLEATGHTEETIPGRAATCTEPGLTDGVKCSVCNETLTAQTEIPTLGHTDESIPGHAATCTEPGLTDGVKCSVCNETLTAQTEIPALGHTDETIPGHAATCTEPGLTDGVKCSVCGIVTQEQVVIPVASHIYTAWTQTDAPTCVTEGTETRGCENCTYTETQIIPATNVHTPGEAVRENENGSNTSNAGTYDMVVRCTVCNKELSRTTVDTVIEQEQFTDHTIPESIKGSYETVEQLAEHMGNAVAETFKESIGNRQMVTHLVDLVLRYTDDGQNWYDADEDHFPENGELTVVLPVPEGTNIRQYTYFVGHMFTTNAFNKTVGDMEYPAVEKFSEDGKDYIRFKVTGLSPFIVGYSMTNPCPDGHTEEVIPGYAATCTEPGLTEGVKCSVCDEILTAQETIDAAGHTEVTLEAVAATCTTPGKTEGKQCSACGVVTIPQTDTALAAHTEVTLDAVAATCTTPGKTEGKQCSTCGVVTVPQTEIPVVDHSYDSGLYTNPSLTANGYTTYTCQVCGNTKIVEAANTQLFVKLDAMDLELVGEVKFIFCFVLPDALVNDPDAYVVLTEAANEMTKADQVVKISMPEFTKAGPDKWNCYNLAQGIAGAEMTSNVTVQFFDGDDNPVLIYDYTNGAKDTKVTKTVLDYVRRVYQNSKNPQSLKDLMTSMVTFGTYAQKYFNVNTNKLATQILAEFGINIPDINQVTKGTITQQLSVTGDKIGLTYNGQVINFSSVIYMRTYFMPAAGYSINDYEFTLTYTEGGVQKTKSVEAGIEGKEFYVDIVNIPVAKWDYMYTITATNIATGESYQVTSSIMAWAKRTIENGTAEAKMIDLAKAMYLYNQAANAHWE